MGNSSRQSYDSDAGVRNREITIDHSPRLAMGVEARIDSEPDGPELFHYAVGM